MSHRTSSTDGTSSMKRGKHSTKPSNTNGLQSQRNRGSVELNIDANASNTNSMNETKPSPKASPATSGLGSVRKRGVANDTHSIGAANMKAAPPATQTTAATNSTPSVVESEAKQPLTASNGVTTPNRPASPPMPPVATTPIAPANPTPTATSTTSNRRASLNLRRMTFTQSDPRSIAPYIWSKDEGEKKDDSSPVTDRRASRQNLTNANAPGYLNHTFSSTMGRRQTLTRPSSREATPEPFPTTFAETGPRMPLPNGGAVEHAVALELWENMRVTNPRWTSEFTSNELAFVLNPFASVIKFGTANETFIQTGEDPSFLAVVLAGSAVAKVDEDGRTVAEYGVGDVIGVEHYFTSHMHTLLHAATANGSQVDALRNLTTKDVDITTLPSALQPHLRPGVDRQSALATFINSQLHGQSLTSTVATSHLTQHPIRPFTVASTSAGTTIAVFSYEDVRTLLREISPQVHGRLTSLIATEAAQRTQIMSRLGLLERLWSSSSTTRSTRASSNASLATTPRKGASTFSPTLSSKPTQSQQIGACCLPIMEETLWSRHVPHRSLHLASLIANVWAPNAAQLFRVGGGGLVSPPTSPAIHGLSSKASHDLPPSSTSWELTPSAVAANMQAALDQALGQLSPAGISPDATTSPTAPPPANSSAAKIELLKKRLHAQNMVLFQQSTALAEAQANEKYWRAQHQQAQAKTLETANKLAAVQRSYDDLDSTHKGCGRAITDFIALEKAMSAPWLVALDTEQQDAERAERLGLNSENRPGGKSSISTDFANMKLSAISNADLTLNIPTLSEDVEEKDNATNSDDHFLHLTASQLAYERARYIPRLTFLKAKLNTLKSTRRELALTRANLARLEQSFNGLTAQKHELEDTVTRLSSQQTNMTRGLDFALKLNITYKNDISSYQTIIKTLLLHLHVKQFMMRRHGLKIFHKLRRIRQEMELKGTANLGEDNPLNERFGDGDGTRKVGTSNELSMLVPTIGEVDFGRSTKSHNPSSSSSNYLPLPGSYVAQSMKRAERERITSLYSPEATQRTEPTLAALSQALGMNLEICAPPPKLAASNGKNKRDNSALANSAEQPSTTPTQSCAELEIILPKLLQAFIEFKSGMTIPQQVDILYQMRQQLAEKKAKQQASEQRAGGSPDGSNTLTINIATDDGEEVDASGLALLAFTDALPVSSMRLNRPASGLPPSAKVSPTSQMRTSRRSSTTNFTSEQFTKTLSQTAAAGGNEWVPNSPRSAKSGQSAPTTPSLLSLLTSMKDESILLQQNFIQLRSQLLLWRHVTCAFFQRNLEMSEKVHDLQQQQANAVLENKKLKQLNSQLKSSNKSLNSSCHTLQETAGQSEREWLLEKEKLEEEQRQESEKLKAKHDQYRRQVRALELQLGDLMIQKEKMEQQVEVLGQTDLTTMERVMDVLNPYATHSLKREIIHQHSQKHIHPWTTSPTASVTPLPTSYGVTPLISPSQRGSRLSPSRPYTVSPSKPSTGRESNRSLLGSRHSSQRRIGSTSSSQRQFEPPTNLVASPSFVSPRSNQSSRVSIGSVSDRTHYSSTRATSGVIDHFPSPSQQRKPSGLKSYSSDLQADGFDEEPTMDESKEESFESPLPPPELKPTDPSIIDPDLLPLPYIPQLSFSTPPTTHSNEPSAVVLPPLSSATSV